MSKMIVAGLIAISVISCVNHGGQFKQGPITIELPVRQQISQDGSVVFSTFSDGGTVKFSITDAIGRKFDVYLDRRIKEVSNGNFETEDSVIYLNAYPSHSNSVRVIDQNGFRKSVLTGLLLP